MSERPLFPNGALARSDAPFRDPSGANAFRDPLANVAATPATPAASAATDVVIAAPSERAEPVERGEPVERLAAADRLGASSGSDNIFASPQAGGVRSYQAGDFAATEGDRSASQLVAGQIALAFGLLGALVFGAVLAKLIFELFVLFAGSLFILGGGTAVTAIIWIWNDANLRRLGVMRPAAGNTAKWAIGYSVVALLLAVAGVAGVTVGWWG